MAPDSPRRLPSTQHGLRHLISCGLAWAYTTTPFDYTESVLRGLHSHSTVFFVTDGVRLEQVVSVIGTQLYILWGNGFLSIIGAP